MNTYICIHGHFFQPPRENPWLEEVELQDSAYPHHDWNARVSAECYAPNAASRILDGYSKIIDIVNNYEKISFDFGPSLLHWLRRREPGVYASILEADAASIERFGGHGAALAQCYNHLIMPLASERDRRTQVIWGISDFEYHFKRKPEGMWLPEGAVDTATLDIMAEQGIRFVVLAPEQARRVRTEDGWREVEDGNLNPREPYRCRLPSGRSLAVFFYDRHATGDVAAGTVLESGERFAHRLQSCFVDDDSPQLVNVAADGELFGHRHPYGEMALAYCLYHLETNRLAEVTVYGEFLEKHPPAREVELRDNTSWTCPHGLERWRGACGCQAGRHPGWTREWRGPLRGALDWLRDNCAQIYERQAARLLDDPWEVRDRYIEVILDRSPENVKRFFEDTVAGSARKAAGIATAACSDLLKLLEIQRHALLMYTGSAWNPDELSSPGPVQSLRCAARSMQLAREVSGLDLEGTFTDLLSRAPSNLAEYGDGAGVYEQLVKPAVLDLSRVAAHYAISSLFKDYPQTAAIHSFTARSRVCDRLEVGRQKLAVGSVSVRSNITGEEDVRSFAVVHLGDHNVMGGVGLRAAEEEFQDLHEAVKEAFLKSDIPGTIRLIEQHFGTASYSFWHLFKDEQRAILEKILSSTLADVEGSLRQIQDHHYPFIQVLRRLEIPVPRTLGITMELLANADLVRLLKADRPDLDRIEGVVSRALSWPVNVDRVTLRFLAERLINGFMEKLACRSRDRSMLDTVCRLLTILAPLRLEPDLWQAQNTYFTIGRSCLKEMSSAADDGDGRARKWMDSFMRLGELLEVAVS